MKYIPVKKERELIFSDSNKLMCDECYDYRFLINEINMFDSINCPKCCSSKQDKNNNDLIDDWIKYSIQLFK